MTETERKVLALLKDCGGNVWEITRNGNAWVEALCRTIERHEAFRQEVSDAVEKHSEWCKSIGRQPPQLFEPFIITKPDPLVDVIAELGMFPAGKDNADQLRAALAKRGLEIREKSDD